MPVSAITLALCSVLSQAPAGAASTPPSAPASATAPTATPTWRGGGFDRVDLLSEDPGLWLHYDVPMLGTYALQPALRFVEQVKVVFRLPWQGFFFGASIGSQSLVYELPLAGIRGLSLTGGIQTQLLFPRGLLVGLAYRLGPVRLGVSMSALTAGSWERPQDVIAGRPIVLPTFGLGLGGDPYQAAH